MPSTAPDVPRQAGDCALAVRCLSASYGDFRALHGVDLQLAQGGALALVGANGAGKSTLLTCVMGGLDAPREAVELFGEQVGGIGHREVFRRGVALVPEGRRLFPSLNVLENLLFGAVMLQGRGRDRLDFVVDLFPGLAGRLRHFPAQLSGGQLQMVAIGRALMSRPRLLLCDEISLGLSPQATEDIYRGLSRIRAETTLILVEQSLQIAIANTDEFCCLVEGRVALAGAKRAVPLEQIRDAYFGAAGFAARQAANG